MRQTDGLPCAPRSIVDQVGRVGFAARGKPRPDKVLGLENKPFVSEYLFLMRYSLVKGPFRQEARNPRKYKEKD